MLPKNGDKYDLRENQNFNVFSSLKIVLHLLFAAEVRNFLIENFYFLILYENDFMRNSKKDYVKSIDECTRMLQKQREDNKYGKLLL